MNILGIIISTTQNVTKTGRNYCCLTVKTSDSFKTLYVWNSNKSDFTNGLGIEATVKENEMGISCVLKDIRFINPVANKELDEIRRNLPESPSEERVKALIDTLKPLIDSDSISSEYTFSISDFFESRLWALYKPYCEGTAATKIHHAFKGGLALHTIQMLEMFAGIYKSLSFTVHPFIVAMGCLYHDYYKLKEYDSDFEIQDEFYLISHPVGSAKVLNDVMVKAGFKENLISHCVHVVLSHHGRKEWGSPVVPATAEAFLVHHLDMLSGHGDIYQNHAGENSSVLQTKILKYQ